MALKDLMIKPAFLFKKLLPYLNDKALFQRILILIIILVININSDFLFFSFHCFI